LQANLSRPIFDPALLHARMPLASSTRSCQCLFLPVLGVVQDRIGHGGARTLQVGQRERSRRDWRFTIWIAVMPTPKECRQHAEEGLKLARETKEIYARVALFELATEFREVAEELERRSHSSHANRRRAGPSVSAPARRRRI